MQLVGLEAVASVAPGHALEHRDQHRHRLGEVSAVGEEVALSIVHTSSSASVCERLAASAISRKRSASSGSRKRIAHVPTTRRGRVRTVPASASASVTARRGACVGVGEAVVGQGARGARDSERELRALIAFTLRAGGDRGELVDRSVSRLRGARVLDSRNRTRGWRRGTRRARTARRPGATTPARPRARCCRSWLRTRHAGRRDTRCGGRRADRRRLRGRPLDAGRSVARSSRSASLSRRARRRHPRGRHRVGSSHQCSLRRVPGVRELRTRARASDLGIRQRSRARHDPRDRTGRGERGDATRIIGQRRGRGSIARRRACSSSESAPQGSPRGRGAVLARRQDPRRDPCAVLEPRRARQRCTARRGWLRRTGGSR